MPFNSVGTTQYWNAATNKPPLVSSIGQNGQAYIVSVAGNTNLDGIANWEQDDWVVYGLDRWYRVPVRMGASPAINALASLIPAADRVPYFTGATTAALAVFTPYARTFTEVINASAARTVLELGAFTNAMVENITNSFDRIIHVDSYPSVAAAFADLGENECLEFAGGQQYEFDTGTLTSLPNVFCVRSDNGVQSTISFADNAAWHPEGLIQNTSALLPATEQALTSNLTAATTYAQIISGSAVGQICTVNTDRPHGLSTNDWVLIRYGSSAAAGQIAYCTEYDSDEGTALDKPVQVTVVDPDTFSYTAYSGTPAATLTIFPFVYKNNQVARVASSADYAVDDLVQIQSTEGYQSFTGTQTVPYGELNTVAQIIDANNIMLSEPVYLTYQTSFSAKITKITKKTPIWKDIKFIGKGPNPSRTSYGESDMGMLMYLLYRPVMINCEFHACDYISHWNRSNYKPYFQNCKSYQTEAAAGGKDVGIIEINYGWAYGNATRGTLYLDCEAYNGRHGFDELAVGTLPGILYDWNLIRPKAFNQWSNNIDTHGINLNGKIIDPVIHGGDGISCRNGSLVCTGIKAYNSKRVFNAYGRVVDITTSVDEAVGILETHISLNPTTDIATPTPNSTNINILYANGENGVFGVRIISPNAHKFIAPYIGPLNYKNLTYYPLYLNTTGTGEIVAPYSESIVGIDCLSTTLYHDLVTNGIFNRVFAYRTGSFTLVGSATAAATGNRYNNVSGVSTSAGTVTKFGLHASSVGNFTNSLDFEFKTISAGAVTKNFRNVPMLIVASEGGAATDDLDTVNGHSTGDLLNIKTNSSAQDIRLTNAGNLRQPEPRTLTESTQIQSYVNNGSTNATNEFGQILIGSKTYDAPSLAAGASTTTTITVTGAALGDFVLSVSFGVDTQGLDIEWQVSAADTVSIRIHNHTGGTIDLASTTIAAMVRKR